MALLYHASPVAGLTTLEPRVSNHGRPLIYFSKKRENVLVYLCNAVEKYCRETGFRHTGKWAKWGPYGFNENGIQRLEEYYPNALADTYAGVTGYIYCVEEQPDMQPLEGIADAVVSARATPVKSCERVEDALAAILSAQNAGLLDVLYYEQTGPAMRAWVQDTVRSEYAAAASQPEYRHFLRGKFDGLAL